MRFVITSAQYRYGTTYYWRVTAHNSYGGTTSGTWSFTTEGTPSGGGQGGGTAQLSEGVHDFTLQAAEAKRYSITMQAGETAIVNTSVSDNATDIDIHAYAPSGSQPIASSTHRAGLPDNIRFVAGTSGQYAVEVANISSSRSAQASLNYQKVPANSSSSSLLNGVYKITETDGQPIQGMSEWWVFANGKLQSYYGWISGADFGLSEDMQYWVDARTGAATAIRSPSATLTVQISQADTVQTGTAVQMTLHMRLSAADGTALDQTYTFTGQLGSDGRVLQGTVHNTISADGQVVGEWSGSVKLTRQ